MERVIAFQLLPPASCCLQKAVVLLPHAEGEEEMEQGLWGNMALRHIFYYGVLCPPSPDKLMVTLLLESGKK